MSKKPRIQEYQEPAGGWGAALAAGAMLWEEGVLLKSGAALFFMNKPGGFKCPSCAWPDPPPHSDPLVFCENGAKALAWESTKKRATPGFFAQYSVTELARQSDYWLEQQGRITHPVRYDFASDHYIPVEWQEAFEMIGKELHALSHPNEAELYLSGRSSNESAFLYRGVFNQRDVQFLNEAEMRRRNLLQGDRVDVLTLASDGITRVVRCLAIVRYNVPDGSCAAYYPEANTLIPLHLYDRQSGTPAAKAVPVVLKRSVADSPNSRSAGAQP